MRAVFVTLATFFALIHAWSPSSTHLALNTDTDQSDFAALQRLATGDEAHQQHNLFATYQSVPIPAPYTYDLGPPKFPEYILSGSSAPYCSTNVTQFNVTCAARCSATPACASYYFFEATNSGTPKLPFWFCYTVRTKLATADFKYNVEANFCNAYNRLS